MTAIEKVFSDPELLEQILLNLTCREFFIYQRVNRHWSAIIKASLKLQNAIFLRTEPSDKASLDPSKKGRFEPVTSTCISAPPLTTKTIGLIGIDTDQALVSATNQTHINLLLCCLFPPRAATAFTPQGHVYNPYKQYTIPAIWDRMLLTQPAANKVCVVIRCKIAGHIGLTYHVVKNADGVTLKDLAQLVESVPNRTFSDPGTMFYLNIETASY